MTEAAFVTRQFENEGRPVVCRFFAPIVQPCGEYQCAWSIDWGDGAKIHRTHGIDGVQALCLAMKVAHTELVESTAYKEGRLTFLGEAALELPAPFEFGD